MNTLTGEYPSSWEDDEVRRWKRDAEEKQQCFYLQFEGSQFHDMTDLSPSLRVTKICYAIYGPPSEDAEDLESTYNKDQRSFAEKIYETIHATHMKAPEKLFQLGFAFIFCKEGEKEYQVPVFRLLWEKTFTGFSTRIIDTACRVYKSAQDWKNNNCLPMVKYCYPKDLYYTCNSDDTYAFDPQKRVIVEFGTSPACDTMSRLGRICDVVITSIGMTVGVAALFTPAGFISAPILLGVGGTSAGYGFGRAAHRLFDKTNHGESITDREGILLMLSIAAAPLHMLGLFASARLAAGAASGRIFSQSERILATVLMVTTFGVDSFSFIINVANIIDKGRNKSLTTLDVLQFSVSTLFFTNTLIQPKTAWGVIKQAQQQRITTIAENMTDVKAKEAFQSYLEQNKGDGSIKATSKIVRNLNRMEDPGTFFKSVENMESVKIAGRKGKTVFVTEKNGTTHQVNPNNRPFFSSKLQRGIPKIFKPDRLRKCLGGDYETHEYLRNPTSQQIGRMNKVFGGAAGYSREIVAYAEQLAKQMGVNDPDQFMSLVEVVAAKAKTDANFNFNDTATVNNFHVGIQEDLSTLRGMLGKKGPKFADEFKALYHYRKHGEEFKNFCSPQFYLDHLPQDILKNGKLTDVCVVTSVLQDGSSETFTRKIYMTPDDGMLAAIEKNGLRTISTMFKKEGGWTDFMSRFKVTNTPPPGVALENLARSAGLDAVRLQLRSNNPGNPVQPCLEGDNWKNEDYQAMVAMLVTYLSDYLNETESDQ